MLEVLFAMKARTGIVHWHVGTIRALPGAWSMPTALVGNDKGDHRGLKNRGEFDDRAEKHGMSTVHLSI
jgi:hypothetical protein